ncbi:uncharacterized protein [Dysidea avara]
MSVSDPLEIHCLVDTPNITNSDDVTISWTGPNGTITNDNRLNITPTVSNGTNHLSTLQFSYLSEDDEGLYECNTAVLDYNKNKTASVELTNFTIPTPNVIVTALNYQQVGDPLLLECNVTTVRGITSSVDIVWITNDKEVERVNNVSGETVDNSVVYSDTYNNGSILSEDDDGTMYQCKIEINTTPLVSSTSTFVADIQPVEQQIFVGRPYKVSCPVFASSELNSTFIWTGPNGVITDDGRLTAVTSDISNDTTSTSTVQFSYLRENDEGSYRCDVTVFGYNYNYSTSLSVELNNITVPTPNVIVTALNNQQVGDPLLLECNVITVRGITSSVDIVWTTNDEVVRRVDNVSGETVDNSVVYRTIYNDSEISLREKDSGTTYQCIVEINNSTLVNATDLFVLNVIAVPLPSNTPGSLLPSNTPGSSLSSSTPGRSLPSRTPEPSSPSRTPEPSSPSRTPEPSSPSGAPGSSSGTSSNTAIIISSVAVVVTLTLAVAIVGCFILNRRRSMGVKWNPPNSGYLTPPIDFDTDYPMIRPPPSTVESLDNEKVLHWIKDIQMPTIDEECASIRSGQTTKDDMLKFIYGNTENSAKDGQKNVNEISSSKDPYVSESAVFYSSDKSSSVNSLTMSGDDIQAALGDYYCEDSTTKVKHNVDIEHLNDDQTPSTSFGGSYIDYRTISLPRQGHQNQTETDSLDSTDKTVFVLTKQLEDNDDIPYVAASEDTGVYSRSCFSDSSIPPPDGGYNSCSIAIDQTTSYIPTVTTPTTTTVHHSDQSMPLGEYVDRSMPFREYVDHSIALQHKSSIV